MPPETPRFSRVLLKISGEAFSGDETGVDVEMTGTVVTRYGHAVSTQHIEVIEASHPVPDANSERGARCVLERVRGILVE